MIKSKVYKDESGSSSVLVILVMLLLITFGVLAMMSSYSNLKIARKNASWTQGYYLLESQAALDYKKVAQTIDEAMVLTEALFVDQTTIDWQVYPFEDTLKVSLEPILDQPIKPETTWLKHVLFNWSFYQLYRAQEGVPEIEPILMTDLLDNEVTVPFEVTFITIHEATGRKLLVSVNLDQNEKATITQWRELPADFNYSNSIGFSDPEENE